MTKSRITSGIYKHYSNIQNCRTIPCQDLLLAIETLNGLIWGLLYERNQLIESIDKFHIKEAYLQLLQMEKAYTFLKEGIMLWVERAVV